MLLVRNRGRERAVLDLVWERGGEARESGGFARGWFSATAERKLKK